MKCRNMNDNMNGNIWRVISGEYMANVWITCIYIYNCNNI